MVTPQGIEAAILRIPWRAACKSSRKLVGRLGWLFVAGLRSLNHEIVVLQSKVADLEKETVTLNDGTETLREAKVIAHEVITSQSERCSGLQDKVDCLVACIANKWQDKYGSRRVSISEVHALTMKRSWDPSEWDGNICTASSDSEVELCWIQIQMEGMWCRHNPSYR